MQSLGQFGTVQGAQAGIEILWFVKVVEKAPVGGMAQPALLPERRGAASAPMAASPLAIAVLASLDVAPLAAPLGLPPLDEPPPSLLADAAPLDVLDPDSLANPELEPAPPLPRPDPAAAPAAETPAAAAPLPAPSAPVVLVPVSTGRGLVWPALHAATSRTAQQNGLPNPRLICVCGPPVGFRSALEGRSPRLSPDPNRNCAGVAGVQRRWTTCHERARAKVDSAPRAQSKSRG
jgi:hypothetical protein